MAPAAAGGDDSAFEQAVASAVQLLRFASFFPPPFFFVFCLSYLFNFLLYCDRRINGWLQSIRQFGRISSDAYCLSPAEEDSIGHERLLYCWYENKEEEKIRREKNKTNQRKEVRGREHKANKRHTNFIFFFFFIIFIRRFFFLFPLYFSFF